MKPLIQQQEFVDTDEQELMATYQQEFVDNYDTEDFGTWCEVSHGERERERERERDFIRKQCP